MNRTLLRVAALGLAVTSIASCSDKTSTAPDGGLIEANASTDAYRTVSSVTVSLAPNSITAGDSAVATAVLRDYRGRIVTGSVTWSTSASAVATVSATGLIRGVAAGSATIRATRGSKSGSATLTVTTPTSTVAVATVTVSLTPSTINRGETSQSTAVARDANNNILSGRAVAWQSANTQVATISSAGLVTAVQAGTAVITAASEGKTGSSTITVNAPAPPPVGGSNEPSGLTLISDRPFNSTTSTYSPGEAGWWDSGGGSGMTIVQDATAPKSPSSVGSMNFNAGMGGGYSPASLEHQVPHTTTLYVAAWVKFSTNWQSHSSGVNKILHLWINGGNKLVITAAGYVANGPLTARVSLQGITSGGNAEGGVTGLYETNTQFVRGQWTKIEVIAVANTSGANGSVKLFIDGVEVVSVSGIQYVPGSGTWDLAMWSPTWGGTGDTVIATQHMYMDHIYLSGK